MPTLHDLIEVTGFPQNTTLETASGGILGVEDNVFWNGSGDIDEGNTLTIGSSIYTIDEIYEPGTNLTMLTSTGVETFPPGSETNLSVMMLQVSNGGETRYFVLPNDSYGDLIGVQSISFGVVQDVAGSDASIDATTNNALTVVCFAKGTLIRLATGQTRDVANLKQGDMVETADHGPKKIRWIGSVSLSEQDLEDNSDLRAIRIQKDAIGPNIPSLDLLVSPQHRILIRSQIAERMFGSLEVLVAAKHLTAINGIEIARELQTVTYYHFLFDQHEIVFANGAATESFYIGKQAFSAIDSDARREILRLFPNLSPTGSKTRAAREFVIGRKASRLAFRHAKNGRDLQISAPLERFVPSDLRP